MTQIVCANCGQALRPTDKFCYNCGAKVQPVKLKPEVEKEVPKAEPVKPAPSVLRPQVQVKPEAPKPAPEKVQEERPKFRMDEAMSWNTDGYPEAQRHPVQNPEEADFTWNESAQDRIKKRQEEGRHALFEEQEAGKAVEERAEAVQFSETPEAEDVVKAVDAASTVPVDSFKAEEAPAREVEFTEAAEIPDFAPETPAAETLEPAAPAAETPEPAAPVIETPAPEEPAAETPAAEAETPAPEAFAEPEKKETVAPAQQFRNAYRAALEQPEAEDTAEADDDYVVPTIESIEKDAEEAKARQTEKDIFGYTLDDIDSGARKEGSSGAEVIDKFYTYSKKQEEFQALLDQENERLKGGRPDAVKPASTIKEELDKAVSTAEEAKPEKPVETGGFVGVQLPETPESVEAYKEPDVKEYVKPAAEPMFKHDEPVQPAYAAPAAEEPKEFLGGNFGKADEIAKNAGSHVNNDRSAAANTVAAAAGAVVSGASAIAAAREKARERIEAEKTAEIDFAKAAPAAQAYEPAPEVKPEPVVQPAEPAAEEIRPEPVVQPVQPAVSEIPAEAPAAEAVSAAETIDLGQPESKAEDKPFGEVVTEESEKEREQSLAEAAEEAAKASAAEIKAAEEAAAEKAVKEEAVVPLEEAQKSIDKVVEETANAAEEEKQETPAEEEHKLTYQDVFNEEVEKTPKHTFLKVIAILILLLIILEVAAILIRRFAPDSALGLQIQQIYEMIFDRFI